MADIKLTLSTDRSKRSPSIEEEIAWLTEESRLWYPLGAHRPKHAVEGCWVYFIRAGQLVARAKAESFDAPGSTGRKHSYTGADTNRGSWEVRITQMDKALRPVPHQGFQGFRYVTHEERGSFEAAFE